MPNKTKGLNYEWLLRVTAAARAGKEVVVATSIPSCPFVGAVSPRADVAAFCVCGSRIRDVVPFNAALFAAKPISALLRGGGVHTGGWRIRHAVHLDEVYPCGGLILHRKYTALRGREDNCHA